VVPEIGGRATELVSKATGVNYLLCDRDALKTYHDLKLGEGHLILASGLFDVLIDNGHQGYPGVFQCAPYEAAVDDVAKVYQLAYELGCKGVTIYRDRSRTRQVLYKGVVSQGGDQLKDEEEFPCVERRPKARQDVIHGSTRKIYTGCGNLYVTVNEDEEGRLFEIFNQIGKAGGCGCRLPLRPR
jgi:hypothetical protein